MRREGKSYGGFRRYSRQWERTIFVFSSRRPLVGMLMKIFDSYIEILPRLSYSKASTPSSAHFGTFFTDFVQLEQAKDNFYSNF